jgi:hypothetical protein
VLTGTPAGAILGTSEAQKCARTKLKAAGKKTTANLTCQANAVTSEALNTLHRESRGQLRPEVGWRRGHGRLRHLWRPGRDRVHGRCLRERRGQRAIGDDYHDDIDHHDDDLPDMSAGRRLRRLWGRHLFE